MVAEICKGGAGRWNSRRKCKDHQEGTGRRERSARDAVVLNAGAGLFVAGKAKNLKEGVKLAQELIDTGKAAAQLEKFIELSNE